MRLQNGKTPRLSRFLTLYFALFVGKFGAEKWCTQLNAIQPGLAIMIFQGVWIPAVMVESVYNKIDAKCMLIGLTKTISESQDIINCNNGALWASGVVAIVKLITLTDPTATTGAAGGGEDAEVEFDIPEISFDSSYSKLHFASKPLSDSFANAGDTVLAFTQSLSMVCNSKPGVLVNAIVAECNNPKVTEAFGEGTTPPFELLRSICTKYGCQLR